MCVSVNVGGLDLEDVRWHSAVRLDAHVFVHNRRWETLALSRRPTDTATANTITTAFVKLLVWITVKQKN